MKQTLEIPDFGKFKRESSYTEIEVEMPLVLKKEAQHGKIYKVLTFSQYYELTIHPSGDYNTFVYDIESIRSQIVWNGCDDSKVLGFVYNLFGFGVSDLKESNLGEMLEDFEKCSQRFKAKLFQDEEVLKYIAKKAKEPSQHHVSLTIEKICKKEGVVPLELT